jgi:hypothetical protein
MHTRRYMALFGGLAVTAVLLAQGMGSGARAVARGSPKARIDRPNPKIEFRDIAATAGLTAANVYGGVAGKRFILEMTGNGVALFDADNDGHLDIFLVNGSRLEGPAPASRLYRNRGDGTFEDISAGSGLTRTGWGQGVCAGDYDNDGLTDLLVTYYGWNVLYRNLGGGRFQDVTAKAGLPAQGQRWGAGCAFVDYDRDGRLDLAVSNYLEFDLKSASVPGSSPFCHWKGLRVFCGPRGFPGGQNWLYRNEGGGRFRDVSEKAGISLQGLHYNLGLAVADYDDDGWPDIYVACDSTPSILYRNNRDGTFTDIAVPAGVAYGSDGQELGGMGASAGDYDNDGRIDIVKTNFIDETPSLFRNEGEGYFEDATYPAGLGVHTKFVGWGVEFLDFDQDGWKDLLMANGHIYPELAGSKIGETYEQSRLLYWNLRNGAFRDLTPAAGAALSTPQSSRGLAVGDLDGDGSPEVVIVNMNQPPSLLKSYGVKGNAILVEAIGTKSNRSAIGARVTITAGGLRQVEEVRSGGSYVSQRDFRLHFGLGSATKVDRLQIRWPNGQTESFTDVPANHAIQIREGEGIAGRSPFRQPVR